MPYGEAGNIDHFEERKGGDQMYGGEFGKNQNISGIHHDDRERHFDEEIKIQADIVPHKQADP
jgi:hypothetical protein